MTTEISEAALLARINRKLAHEGQKICKSRIGSGAYYNCGAYYLIDIHRNIVIASHCNLEEYGKDLNVLHESEKML